MDGVYLPCEGEIAWPETRGRLDCRPTRILPSSSQPCAAVAPRPPPKEGCLRRPGDLDLSVRAPASSLHVSNELDNVCVWCLDGWVGASYRASVSSSSAKYHTHQTPLANCRLHTTLVCKPSSYPMGKCVCESRLHAGRHIGTKKKKCTFLRTVPHMHSACLMRDRFL